MRLRLSSGSDLWFGRLVWFGSGQASVTLTENRLLLFTIFFVLSTSRFDVYLNGELIHSGWFGNVHVHLALDQLLYVGGVEPSLYILLPVPVHWSFQGDFQAFSVNSQ